jgi:hypothetical protein
MVHYDQNVMGIALELLQAILAASHSPSRNAVLNSQLVPPQTGSHVLLVRSFVRSLVYTTTSSQQDSLSLSRSLLP